MHRTRAPHALTVPRPQPPEAAAEGLAELHALHALLADLADDEWDRATASAGWAVHDIVAHLAGQHVESARPWTIPGKLRQARRRYPGRSALDAHNALQILDYGDRTPEELRWLLAHFGPKAVRAPPPDPGLRPAGKHGAVLSRGATGRPQLRLPLRGTVQSGHLAAPARNRARHGKTVRHRGTRPRHRDPGAA
jgi:hypothetical protein